MSDPLQHHGLYSPWNSLGQNTGVGSCSHLQGIFPTQGVNPGFLHCRRILHQLSHQGSTRITGVSSLSLLQHISPTQELNWGLLHCRWILYQLSYQGSPDWHFSHCLYTVRPSLVAQMVKNLPAKQEIWVWSLGWEDPLEKEMATHSSILAWKIPWTEEPDGLQSMGLYRVRHDRET